MKKVLIIGHTFPEPTTTAAGSRIMQLIEVLRQEYTIIVASTAVKTDKTAKLESTTVSSKNIELNNSSFDEFLRKEQPTIVIFDRFITEEQFGWRVSEVCPNAIKILDTEDLHFLRKAREKAIKENIPVEKAHLFTETAKRELASIYRCDLSLIISEAELKLLTTTFSVPKQLLFYVPFLFKTEEPPSKTPGFSEREHFITIGNLLHAPNVDSVKVLKNEIWPQLKEKFPKAELHIYGAYAPQQITQLHNDKEGFIIKGWVEDCKTVMQQAKVCLAPIRFGAGLKGKLFDAMQCGTPFVTTKIGAEGIAETTLGDCKKDNWQHFTDTAAMLYSDEKQWLKSQQIGFEILYNRFAKTNFEPSFLEKIKHLEAHLQNHRNTNFFGQILQHHTTQSTKYLAKWIEEKNK